MNPTDLTPFERAVLDHAVGGQLYPALVRALEEDHVVDLQVRHTRLGEVAVGKSAGYVVSLLVLAGDAIIEEHEVVVVDLRGPVRAVLTFAWLESVIAGAPKMLAAARRAARVTPPRRAGSRS